MAANVLIGANGPHSCRAAKRHSGQRWVSSAGWKTRNQGRRSSADFRRHRRRPGHGPAAVPIEPIRRGQTMLHGQIASFSNSLVFVSPATGLLKFDGKIASGRSSKGALPDAKEHGLSARREFTALNE